MLHSIRWRIAIPFVLVVLASTLGLGLYLAISPSANATYVIAVASASASLLALVLAVLLARSITKPIRRLTQTFARMTEGQLHQHVRVESSDEVGELAHAFNQMSARVVESVRLISRERASMAIALANMEDGVLITDRNGAILMANAAAERLLRLSQCEMVSRSFVEVVRDHDLARVLTDCLESSQQRTNSVETGPDRRFVRIIATPIEGTGQSAALIMLQDFTELRRLETARRDFASNISHELRTPLASIKALAETLGEGAVDDTTVAAHFLESIKFEVDKLSQMVEELGELSRIETGEVALQMESVNIAELISRVVERLHPQVTRAGLNLELRVSESLPRPAADRERIEHVLLNIMHNAIKFTPPGGKVTVAARAAEDVVAVSVSDTGIGIDSSDLTRVFERFYKADKARSRGGTGLGLAIAKHIIHAHRGRIWAESPEGKGSTFTFTLPLPPAPRT